MKKALVILVLFFLFVGSVGVLFTKWWHARTASLHFPIVSPFPIAQAASLGRLLEHMRPLTSDEKTLVLSSQDGKVSGLIRYTKQDATVSFTVFVLAPETTTKHLHLWIVSQGKEKDEGELYEGKGGWLLDGTLQTEMLPSHISIAPLLSGKKGAVLLSGDLPS